VKEIKIYYFEFEVVNGSQPIVDTLRELEKYPLSKRLRDLGDQKIRLDTICEKNTNKKKSEWHLKFSKTRTGNWPGISTNNDQARDLELKNGEFLSEETFAIFSPLKNRLIIQHNHHGVSANKIRDYLNQMIPDPLFHYKLQPILNKDAKSLYKNRTIFTAIDARIDGISEADIAVMDGSSLEHSLKKSLESQATTFSFTFAVDARNKANLLDENFVKSLIDKIFKRSGDNDSIKVHTRESMNNRIEIFDLLEQRKVTKLNAINIKKTGGKRYEPAEIFERLSNYMNEWK
jgi:hypothetical protein